MRKRIEGASSIQEVVAEYKKYFSKEEIDKYLNMDMNTTKDDSICITENDGVYDINYVLNDSQAILGRSVVDVGKFSLYSELFDLVYALKNFHVECNDYLNKLNASSSDIISLLSIYQSGSQINVEEKKNMNSNVHNNNDELLKMIRSLPVDNIPNITNGLIL